MAPGSALTFSATPEDFSALSPAPPSQLPLLPLVQLSGAAVVRYLPKFSLVPDLSLRYTGVTLVSGRVAPGFSAAIAGSFQAVMTPVKILAAASAFRTSLSTPGRLYANAIGPKTTGRFHASLPPQRSLALPASSSDSAESEPPMSTWPAMKLSRPLPEPVGL
ncbi:Uncharacterised protein [Mycobacteroides abscessus subsp. abscessus]|nr:Uncharacterised protein [Mycobacteroides abscessus subsp. abscessus]